MERVTRIKELLKANPADSFLQHALALEYMKTGDLPAARQLFENILAIDPMYTGSYYHLAKLLEGMGDTALAAAWYEKGMAACKTAGDHHTYAELKAAHDNLLDN